MSDELKWHVTFLTPERAEAHDRMCYGVQSDTLLGWKPYTIRVTHAAISQVAFHNRQDFRQWLRRQGLTFDRPTTRGLGMRAFLLRGVTS